MLCFCFCNGELLLKKESGDTYFIPEEGELPSSLVDGAITHDVVFHDEKVKAFCLTASYQGDDFVMMPLRQSWHHLSREHYDAAGKCAEILHWDKNTHYCGICGSRMEWHTDISKRCQHCGNEIWPSLSIAVIVRITRGDEILLVHAKNFKRDFYGLVAGFVETAENLEEAVVREVREEVGLEITNLRYFTSQPWPYPCGLMVGFTAEYLSGEVRLQEEELSKGAWFHRNNLPNIPEKLSIARRLIDDWLTPSS